MMKLLAFLGTASYQPTTYISNDQQHRTSYCPAAVAHFYQPDQTLIVVTEAAQAKHFESLAEEISTVTQPLAVPIPDGHSEAELWQIFQALTEQVEEGDELVVDITYGFRSLPFLSFLAIAFLRLARRVKVRRVLYGAWEARNQETNETPVFDLTPFVTLLDWTIATDRFTRFGDANDLAELLRKEMPAGLLMKTDLQARELGTALRQAAKTMEAISLTLRLTRPIETMKTGAQLQQQLTKVSPIIAENILPFAVLTDQIQQAYRPFALAEPLDKKNWLVNLQIQFDLVGWYVDKGQVVQALTLAREWVVSVLIYRFGADSMVKYKPSREPVEWTLGNGAERVRGGTRPPRVTRYEAQFQALPNEHELSKLWDKLGQVRNDLAHAGMNRKPKSADKLRQEATKIYAQLRTLAKEMEIVAE